MPKFRFTEVTVSAIIYEAEGESWDEVQRDPSSWMRTENFTVESYINDMEEI